MQRLGEGGMGEVWLADDVALDRQVAIKFPMTGEGKELDRNARLRLMLEGRAIARLRHPNLIVIYYAGEIDGHPYIVTELLSGRSLDRVELPLGPDLLNQVALGLARGLAAAHEAGIIHRDIKPGNVFLSDDGTIKLIDFGIAKVDHTDRSEQLALLDGARGKIGEKLPAHVSRTGGLIGTPLYLAPEIWFGEVATPKTDLYAYGVLMYQLACGETPYYSDELAVLFFAAISGEYRPIKTRAKQIDDVLAKVIDRCLSRDPRERPESAAEIYDLLETGAEAARRARSRSRIGPPEGRQSVPPYRGLAPYTAADRELFFGREGEAMRVLEQCGLARLTAVAGSSGAGKTSFLEAAILPRVREGALGGREWQTIVFRPGKRPLEAFARALSQIDEEPPPSDPRLLAKQVERVASRAPLFIAVDQFEQCLEREAEAGLPRFRALLEHLLEIKGELRILVLLRSDALAELERTGRVRSAILRSTMLLGKLPVEARRRIVSEPARIYGYSFDPESLIDEIASGTESLPLLQFALARLWEARDIKRKKLTAVALAKMGGIAGALARYADASFDALPEQLRRAARHILVQLAAERGHRVELDVLFAQSTDPEPVRRGALAALIEARLVVAFEGERGPAHELAYDVLLEGWPRLRGWIDEEAAASSALGRLRRAVAEWERCGAGEEGLWRGRQLAALELIERRPLNARERAFIRASKRHDRRERWAWLSWPLSLATAAVVAIATSWLVWRSIEDRKERAIIPELEARANRALEEIARLEQRAASARALAFSQFDSGDRVRGERSWNEALDLQERAGRQYDVAADALERAHVQLPGDEAIAARLADTLYRWILAAERTHQGALERDLRARLASVDDGSRAALLAKPAGLTVRDSGSKLMLFPVIADADGRRRLGEPRALERGVRTSLEPGSWVIEAAVPGGPSARLPLLLRRGEELWVKLALPPLERVAAGFVFIPGGRTAIGSADSELVRRALGAEPEHDVEIGSFFIQATETTFAQYVEFLRALPEAERAARRPNAAGVSLKLDAQGEALLEMEGTVTKLGEMLCRPARAVRTCRNSARLPVTGISYEDAQAYARWLASTNRVPGARLCKSREWERAARGADGRIYPGGDVLSPGDANIDATYDRDPERMGPDQVGEYEGDTSVFGVRDLSGNVFEWTVDALAAPGSDARLLRGGNYDADADLAKASAQGPASDDRHASVGVRICAD